MGVTIAGEGLIATPRASDCGRPCRDLITSQSLWWSFAAKVRRLQSEPVQPAKPPTPNRLPCTRMFSGLMSRWMRPSRWSWRMLQRSSPRTLTKSATRTRDFGFTPRMPITCNPRTSLVSNHIAGQPLHISGAFCANKTLQIQCFEQTQLDTHYRNARRLPRNTFCLPCPFNGNKQSSSR